MPGTGSGASSGAKGTTRPPFPAAPLLVFAPLAAGVALAGFASYRTHTAEHRAQAREQMAAIAAEPSLARALARPRGEFLGAEHEGSVAGLLRREGGAT